MSSLRSYQSRVLRAISEHFSGDKKSVLLQMPTGSGKTRTADYVVGKYAETGRQVLWLVHRDELLSQAAMVFAGHNRPHRLICSAESERAIKIAQHRELGQSFVDSSACIVVASVQTLVRRLDTVPWLNPALIIADEAHLSLNATNRRIIGRWPEARLLGLTATPERSDGQAFARNAGGLYDAIVCGPQIYELIQEESLSDYRLYRPPVRMKEGVKLKSKGGDYDPKSLDEEFDSPFIWGDVLQHYRSYSHGKPAIGFCASIETARRFADVFTTAGYRAIALDGDTDGSIRRGALRDLAVGALDVIFSVNILTEGTDVPYATTCLWLRRTKSLAVYLQGNGRVLRPHSSKPFAIFLDFVGNSLIHGYPDAHFYWSLDGKPRRARGIVEDGEIVDSVTCPQCFSMHEPAPNCPKCGHVYTRKPRREIEQIEGDLVFIEREQREQERQRMNEELEKQQAKWQRRREEAGCKTLEELIELGRRRGYAKPAGWAWGRFNARQNKK